jgi:hypothetical protein
MLRRASPFVLRSSDFFAIELSDVDRATLVASL